MSAKTLTLQQVAKQIGTNLGTIIQMRAKGARLFDATFPPMTNGTFNAADISAWQTARTTPSSTSDDGMSAASLSKQHAPERGSK